MNWVRTLYAIFKIALQFIKCNFNCSKIVLLKIAIQPLVFSVNPRLDICLTNTSTRPITSVYLQLDYTCTFGCKPAMDFNFRAQHEGLCHQCQLDRVIDIWGFLFAKYHVDVNKAFAVVLPSKVCKHYLCVSLS